MPHKIAAMALAGLTGALLAISGTTLAQQPKRYSLGIIYEDAATVPGPISRRDVAAYAANGLTFDQCQAIADQLISAGGFAFCFQETTQ